MGFGRLKGRVGWTGLDPLPPVTTGSLQVAQFIPNQKPFVVDFNVTIADSHDLKDRPLVAVVREAKAVTQIMNLLSLAWSTA